LFRVERTLAASESLADNFSFFVNEYGHEALLINIFGNGCAKKNL
jgi:hypothetical protein